MSSGSKVHREDTVYVIAGRDRGKSGRVLRVQHGRNRALVEGINLVRKAVKANPSKNIKGGVVESEVSVHISNLQVVCPECNTPTRVGRKILEDGSRVRVCRKCSGIIEKS